MHASMSRLAIVRVLMSAACAGPRPKPWEPGSFRQLRMPCARSPSQGLSVAVVRHGRPVLAKGYGYANLSERDKQPWGLSATWTSNGGGKG